jgi:hypothetical protein
MKFKKSSINAMKTCLLLIAYFFTAGHALSASTLAPICADSLPKKAKTYEVWIKTTDPKHKKIHGTIYRLDDDKVWVIVRTKKPTRLDTLCVAVCDIQKISAGPKMRPSTYAKIGAAAGMVFYGIGGLLFGTGLSSALGGNASENLTIGAAGLVYGAVLGAAFGAFYGLLIGTAFWFVFRKRARINGDVDKYKKWKERMGL